MKANVLITLLLCFGVHAVGDAAVHEVAVVDGDHREEARGEDGVVVALARADVGLAMAGSGSAQAMETADVLLMQDDLRRVPAVLRMARLTRRVVRQNVALSLGLKLAFLLLAIPGWATLWLAIAADVGATLLVTANGMRLLRAEDDRRHTFG